MIAISKHWTRARFHSPLFLSRVQLNTSGMEGCITLPSCEPQVLNFLGAKINYGGRVTDDKDKLFLVCNMYELGISEAENVMALWVANMILHIWYWVIVLFFLHSYTMYKWIKHSFQLFLPCYTKQIAIDVFPFWCGDRFLFFRIIASLVACHPFPWAYNIKFWQLKKS